MSLFERIKVVYDLIDLEVLLIFELLQIGFGDLDAIWERLWERKSIVA